MGSCAPSSAAARLNGSPSSTTWYVSMRAETSRPASCRKPSSSRSVRPRPRRDGSGCRLPRAAAVCLRGDDRVTLPGRPPARQSRRDREAVRRRRRKRPRAERAAREDAHGRIPRRPRAGHGDDTEPCRDAASEPGARTTLERRPRRAGRDPVGGDARARRARRLLRHRGGAEGRHAKPHGAAARPRRHGAAGRRRDLHRQKLDVVRTIRVVRSRRARYTEGRLADGRHVPSYADEKGVDPVRRTETFAEVEFELETPRWDGTRFVLRTGKALADASQAGSAAASQRRGARARHRRARRRRLAPRGRRCRPARARAPAPRAPVCPRTPTSSRPARRDECTFCQRRGCRVVVARHRPRPRRLGGRDVPLAEYAAGTAGPS